MAALASNSAVALTATLRRNARDRATLTKLSIVVLLGSGCPPAVCRQKVTDRLAYAQARPAAVAVAAPRRKPRARHVTEPGDETDRDAVGHHDEAVPFFLLLLTQGRIVLTPLIMPL
jgi:hypothetical protein